MSPDWDVLGIGAVAVDDLVYVDRYPAPDSKAPIREQQRQGGGLAGTALVAAARLGARAAYCGVLGEDELSRYTIQELEREGVDCSPILRVSGARPIHSIIIIDRSTAQRVLLFDLPPEPDALVGAIEADAGALIARCRALFVDHTVIRAALRAMAQARRRGIPVIADVETADAPGLAEFLGGVDHLILGADMAGLLTGVGQPEAMVQALSSPERACCVVTGGAQGCWYAEHGGAVRHFPAFPVQPVDTTGCGDVFHGAYAACLAWGWGVEQAIAVASAAAAIKATRPGGRAGIPTMPAVEAFLRQQVR